MTNIYMDNWSEIDWTYDITEGLSSGNTELLKHMQGGKNAVKKGMSFYKEMWGKEFQVEKEFEKRKCLSDSGGPSVVGV